MKGLLKFLYLLLTLLIIFSIIGVFLPSSAIISASKSVNAPSVVIFENINAFKNWEKWSPWLEVDTTLVNHYSGPYSGVGATTSWKGESLGEGSQTIIESDNPDYIKTSLDFGGKGVANGIFNIEESDSGSKVTWTMEQQNMSYFEKYFMAFMKKKMHEVFNNGLSNLKELCEAEKNSRFGEITVNSSTAQKLLLVKDSATMGEMPYKMGEMYGKLMTYIVRKELETTGYPLSIYYKWANEGYTNFACAMPINEKVRTYSKTILYEEIPAQKVVTVDYWGDYKKMEKAYTAMFAYLETNDLKLSGAPWEEYHTDPMSETDTTKWLTRIYYPVE